MFLKSIISLSAGCALATFCTTSIINQAKASEQVRFICASGFDQRARQRFPTTYAWTQRGKIAVVRWKYDWFSNSDYNPQRRCQEVSSRFQAAYDNQSINYITNGIHNSQRVICTSSEKGGTCDTTLLTLRPNDDSLEILTQLKQTLKGQGTGPIEHSSKRQTYYKIDMDKFLQTAPVESE